MKKYLVESVINCNSSEDVSRKVFSDYDKAKAYFDSEVKDLAESYMEDDDETLEQWLDRENGVIVDEYKGTVSDHYVEFDFNSIELTEVEED